MCTLMHQSHVSIMPAGSLSATVNISVARLHKLVSDGHQFCFFLRRSWVSDVMPRNFFFFFFSFSIKSVQSAKCILKMGRSGLKCLLLHFVTAVPILIIL